VGESGVLFLDLSRSGLVQDDDTKEKNRKKKRKVPAEKSLKIFPTEVVQGKPESERSGVKGKRSVKREGKQRAGVILNQNHAIFAPKG